MAAEVGGLLINLGLDVAQIKQDVGKAQRELSGFRNKVDRNMAKVQRSFKRATQGVQGLVAVLGAQQLGAAIGRTLSSFEEINRQARTLGASRETIQELQFAFRQFGLQQQDVTDALATVSDRADDALSGMQSFIDDFERFGIEVESLRNKSPGELFRTVAQGISELDSESKQVTAAVRIFGDEVGQRLLPLLTQGAEGIDKFAMRARELGVIVSDQLVKDSAKAAKDFRALKEVLTAQFAATVAKNAEELQTTANALMDIATWGAEAAASLVKVGENMQFSPDEANQFKTETLGGVNSELERMRDLQDKIANSRAGQQGMLGDPQKVERQIQMLEARRQLLERNLQLQAKRDVGTNTGAFGDFSTGGAGGSQSSGSESNAGSDAVVLPSMTRMGRRTGSRFKALIEIQKDAAKQTQKTGDTITNVQNNIQNNQVEVNQTFERTGDIVADSFRAATREGATLRGVVQGLLRDLAAMQVNKAANNIGNAVTGALSASFGGSSTTGTLASVGGVGGATPRAEGGPVRQGGSYLVGEEGPELFTPGRSGGITPNDKMGGGGVTYNIDARGADQAAIARLERTIKAVSQSVEPRAVAAVGNRRQRSFRG